MQVAACLGAFACAAPDNRRLAPIYDEATARLTRLCADQDRDGRLDQCTYLDGNRPLRGEADVNADGRIDRWEYFDSQGRLTHVGTSSVSDGVEDIWEWPVGADGEWRRDVSRRRDRQIDRREFRRGDQLVRAEEDTNADGRPDRWDRYEGEVLREVAYDTTFTAARANYRLWYDAKGQFTAVESDLDGDGAFVRLSGAEAAAAAAAAKAGVQK